MQSWDEERIRPTRSYPTGRKKKKKEIGVKEGRCSSCASGGGLDWYVRVLLFKARKCVGGLVGTESVMRRQVVCGAPV